MRINELDSCSGAQYTGSVPLTGRITAHLIASCDGCRGSYPKTAEVCAKRLEGEQARNKAIEILLKAGWHVDGRGQKGERWYCPTCAKQPHL